MAKILIVDDSKFIRSTLKVYCEAGGHEVVFEAKNGLEGVEAFEKFRPDLVTMDISMPELDGIEALKRIMVIDPEAKVIMMSALHQKELVLGSINLGASNYLLKPVTKEKALQTIKKYWKNNL